MEIYEFHIFKTFSCLFKLFQRPQELFFVIVIIPVISVLPRRDNSVKESFYWKPLITGTDESSGDIRMCLNVNEETGNHNFLIEMFCWGRLELTVISIVFTFSNGNAGLLFKLNIYQNFDGIDTLLEQVIEDVTPKWTRKYKQ